MIRFVPRHRGLSTALRRAFITPPFQNELTEVDADDFNLSDFQHIDPSKVRPAREMKVHTISEVAKCTKPLVVISKLEDPYVNLALEEYIFHNMPLPRHKLQNYNRLMFYTNTPCVVIGKNQNPWQEANLPLLNSLEIPLVRRNSGGGTVVHDLGNVNFSYMTTKESFDRFKFAQEVCNAVNDHAHPAVPLEVNQRGDIVTETINGVNYKVSGSAYKLAKGRSYHHGTMLLNLKLDILSQLLSRDESKLGKVDAMTSIQSVKSKVRNVEISSETFHQVVTEQFRKISGAAADIEVLEVTKDHEMPTEVSEVAAKLRTTEWKFGHTPKFTHEIHSDKFGLTVKFTVERKAIVSGITILFDEHVSAATQKSIRDAFEYLILMVDKGEIHYSGSDVAGFVTDDEISDWLGMSIDGTS